jgi:hypothetical protein
MEYYVGPERPRCPLREGDSKYSRGICFFRYVLKLCIHFERIRRAERSET